MNTSRDFALEAIAEAIYEWNMKQDGWKNVKNFANLDKESQEDYLEIAIKVAEIYENYLDEEDYEEDDLDPAWELVDISGLDSLSLELDF